MQIRHISVCLNATDATSSTFDLLLVKYFFLFWNKMQIRLVSFSVQFESKEKYNPVIVPIDNKVG